MRPQRYAFFFNPQRFNSFSSKNYTVFLKEQYFFSFFGQKITSYFKRNRNFAKLFKQ